MGEQTTEGQPASVPEQEPSPAQVQTGSGSPSQPHPQVGDVTQPPADGKAVASLITGIASLVLWWIPFLGFGAGAAAIVLGSITLAKKQPGKGMSIAGVICGGVGVLGTVLFWAVIVVVLILGTNSPNLNGTPLNTVTL